MTASTGTNIILSQTTIGVDGDDLKFTNPLTVTIATTDDEENLTKSLIFLPTIKSGDKQDKNTESANYGPQERRSIDLLKDVEQRITVDGYLVSDVNADYSGDSKSTAEGKKADLKKIFLGGGVVNMLYEGSVITVSIDKLSIKRERKDGLAGEEGVAEFSVKFTAVRSVGF